ncbi:MAG TPA: hypothetical protein VE861_16180 [Gemmatimonadaceae bacterium]|nr:hypothetical protein [Gemmatimonadaceae bacterium]
MQNRIFTLAAVALLAVPAHAQLTSTVTSATRAELAAERRLQLEQRLDAAAAVRAARTPEQREQARARRAALGNTVSETQLQFRSELRSYRSGLREKARDLRQQVNAGTMTASEMAVELKAYREANRPGNPAGEMEKPNPRGNSAEVRQDAEATGRVGEPARTARPTKPNKPDNR